jgi:hypothetical protein
VSSRFIASITLRAISIFAAVMRASPRLTA